jgi:hypothetical protein
MRRRHDRAELERAGVTVEKLGLSAGVEQGMVLVLTVHRDQVATQLSQLSRICASTVDPSRASLPELPLENQRRPAGLEQALNSCSIGAVPDLVDTAASA